MAKREKITLSFPPEIAAYLRTQHNMSEYIRSLVLVDMRGDKFESKDDLLRQIRSIVQEALNSRNDGGIDIGINVLDAIDSLTK
jgi:hypothetical protein